MPAATPDATRVDPLLQFILAVAGQQDEPRDRELGPIHLLKYAYLADLAHAESRDGETFTGVQWQFYDFGPWSPAVLDRVEPALLGRAGAERNVIQSARYGDFVRYSLHDKRLLDALDHVLPGPVVSAVRWAVGEFGSDTPALLRHVYLTRPMLRASPGEYLVFEPRAMEVADPEGAPALDESRKLAKQRKKLAEHLREEVRRRLAERRTPVPAGPPPRYDEIFFEGVAWLDHQAGSPFPVSDGELVFSPEVWKSRGRAESGEDAS